MRDVNVERKNDLTVNDIQNKDDVAVLVKKFYERATVDPTIGHFFTTVMQLDWAKHIPLITNFWYSLLFGERAYTGNPMDAHFKLNKLSPMEKQHFGQWVELWSQTVRENFEGPRADEAVMRGGTIAQIMALKINP